VGYYISKAETVAEAEFLMSLRVSHWQAAKQLGIEVKTLERYWYQIRGQRAPWAKGLNTKEEL